VGSGKTIVLASFSVGFDICGWPEFSRKGWTGLCRKLSIPEPFHRPYLPSFPLSLPLSPTRPSLFSGASRLSPLHVIRGLESRQEEKLHRAARLGRSPGSCKTEGGRQGRRTGGRERGGRCRTLRGERGNESEQRIMWDNV